MARYAHESPQAELARPSGAAPAGDAKAGQASAQLAREARKDLVRVYAEFRKPEEARAFFEPYGEPQSQSMMEHLAEAYAALGKWQESVVVFRELLLREGSPSEKRCAWQRGVVTGLQRAGSSESAPEVSPCSGGAAR